MKILEIQGVILGLPAVGQGEALRAGLEFQHHHRARRHQHGIDAPAQAVQIKSQHEIPVNGVWPIAQGEIEDIELLHPGPDLARFVVAEALGVRQGEAGGQRRALRREIVCHPHISAPAVAARLPA